MIEVENLSVGFRERVVLDKVDLTVPQSGIFCVMGPAGGGKSTLLRTLGRWNDGIPSFWRRGSVRWYQRDLLGDLSAEEVRRGIALLIQKAQLYSATVRANVIAELPANPGDRRAQDDVAEAVLTPLGLWHDFRDRLDDAAISLSIGQQRRLSIARLVAGNAECLLLDEPFRDLDEKEVKKTERLIQRLGKRLAVLLVTHNQQRARNVAHQVCLLVGGTIVEHRTVDQFFGDPRSELAKDYIRLGNCWPRPPATDSPVIESAPPAVLARDWSTPASFHWVLDRMLGGMQQPGLLQDEAEDLRALAGLGCKMLLTLREKPYVSPLLAKFGIETWHFPIVDMSAPEAEAAHQLCRRIEVWLEQGLPTVVHCRAGLGRTGTILACYLVYGGKTSVHAVHAVRAINPNYIQSQRQLTFIDRFADYMAELDSGALDSGSTESMKHS